LLPPYSPACARSGEQAHERRASVWRLSADEFPELGVLSLQSVGGTSTVLNLYVEEVDALWERVVGAGAEVLHPLGDTFWGDRHAASEYCTGQLYSLDLHMIGERHYRGGGAYPPIMSVSSSANVIAVLSS
jgi:hypothetical protein